MSSLGSLRTLKLFLQPAAIRHQEIIGIPGTTDELRLSSEMQKLANLIFKRLQYACPRLRVVVLEARGRRDDCSSLVLRYCYLRGVHLEYSGGLVPIGTPVDEYLIDIHESCSDILEE